LLPLVCCARSGAARETKDSPASTRPTTIPPSGSWLATMVLTAPQCQRNS